jgi:hypothetical protein
MDLLRRKVRPELKPPDTLSRYVVTKHAWYKHYKRIFLVTPTAIHTQNPERTLVLTNSYTFAGDSDIESVSLGTDEFEFVISARQDKRVSSNRASVACSVQCPFSCSPQNRSMHCSKQYSSTAKHWSLQQQAGNSKQVP